jgi:urease accessory protein
MPDTLVQGLLAGLLQPLLGIAYLAAFVAVGMIAAAQPLGWLMGLVFSAGLLFGAFLQVLERVVAGADALIALSVVALGAMLVRALPVRAGIAMVVLALAGTLEGYGLASFASGAQDAALYGYLTGIVLIQLLISYGVMLLAPRMKARTWFQPVWIRLIGAGIVGIGITLLVDQLTAGTPPAEEEEEGAQVSSSRRNASLAEGNQPALRFIPEHQAHAAEALQQSKPAQSAQFRIVA